MCGTTELKPNWAPQEKIGTYLIARFDGCCKMFVVIGFWDIWYSEIEEDDQP